MQDPHGGGGAATKIEWDQEKLTEYFTECEAMYLGLAEALDEARRIFENFYNAFVEAGDCDND